MSVARDAALDGRREDAIAVLKAYGIEDAETVVDHPENYVIIEHRSNPED